MFNQKLLYSPPHPYHVWCVLYSHLLDTWYPWTGEADLIMSNPVNQSKTALSTCTAILWFIALLSIEFKILFSEFYSNECIKIDMEPIHLCWATINKCMQWTMHYIVFPLINLLNWQIIWINSNS